MTYDEVVAELALVTAAIEKTYIAQSYGASGRNKTMAMLDSLVKRKNQLESWKKRLDPSNTAPSTMRDPLFATRTDS